MLTRYRHTQIGYLTITALGAAFIMTVYLIISTDEARWIPFLVTAVLILALVSFTTLTVEITNDTLEVRFGTGIIKKRFALKDIASYRAVRNHWYYGWGIRFTPHGWLYNVSGFDAIEIGLRGGRKFRIGTDDPAGLGRALRQVVKQ